MTKTCDDGVMATQETFQFSDGGSIPTSSLQVKDYKVFPCERKEIKNFIEIWHYSKSINGLHSQHCFKLVTPDDLIAGAAVLGTLAMANQWKRFGKSEQDVIEIRRLCCIDSTPKNVESYFISHIVRWLKRNTNYKVIVSYADASFGHQGTIYKASNFKQLDFRKGAPVILWNGKRYHDKALRTKYKGELKPFAKKLKKALEDGEAKLTPTKGKYTYVYYLESQ